MRAFFPRSVLLSWLLVCGSASAEYSLDSFTSRVFPHGSIEKMAVGDVDGDGLDDVVVLSLNTVGPGWQLWLMRQNARGLAPEQLLQLPFATSSGYFLLRMADLDGDGRQEIITGGTRGLIRMTVGSSARAITTTLSADPVDEADIADFDGDGSLDILTTRASSGASLLYGDGKGTVAGQLSLALPSLGYFTTAAGDLNGDGLPDFVVANNRAYVFLNDGNGAFTNSVVIEPEFDGRLIATMEVEDFNRDGTKELMLAKAANSPTLLSFYQLAAGTFSEIGSVPVLDLPYSSTAADFDGDGSRDLALVHSGFGRVGLLLQTSAGLQTEQLYTIPFVFDRNQIAVSDMNRDGCNDAIVSKTDSINILRGLNCKPAPDLRLTGQLTLTTASVVADNLSSSTMANDVTVTLTLSTRLGTLRLGVLPSGCTVAGAVTNSATVECRHGDLEPLATRGWIINYISDRVGGFVKMTAAVKTASVERVLTNNRLTRTLFGTAADSPSGSTARRPQALPAAR